MVFLCLNLKYDLCSSTKAMTRYIINGDPNVIKERYIKYNLILDVAMPSLPPHHEHTPNALCSKKSVI